MKNLVVSGDWHIGAATVDTDRVKTLVKKYFRGRPIILMGDLIDMGLDRGMEFQNKIKPQEQMDLVKEVCKSLDVRGWCTGNHEQRIFKKTGLNPYIDLFKSKPSHEVKLNGRKIYFNHGKSAAENNFLEHTKYAKWVNADMIALGHSHFLGKITVLKDGKLCHYVRTGSFMGGEDYAVQAGFAPQINGWIEYDLLNNYVHVRSLYQGEVKEI